MSRIGNAPIAIPDGVDISIAGRDVTVKGSKGELSMTLPGEITASIEDGTFTAVRPDDSGENKAMHGLARTLVANMVTGVSEGFTKGVPEQCEACHAVGHGCHRRRRG